MITNTPSPAVKNKATTTVKGKTNVKKNASKEEKKPQLMVNPAACSEQELQDFLAAGGTLPFSPIHLMYKPRGPLIEGDILDVADELGIDVLSLEKHYMDNFKKSESERQAGFLARLFSENYHYGIRRTL
jgi:hypothetical protein